MSDTQTFDNDVRVQIYRFFIDSGRAPVAAEIAPVLDARPVDVEDSYRRLHDGRVVVLAPGTPYIWMANPFSSVPTPYQAHVNNKTYFGNCIWDALGIVALFGGTGSVTAKCGDCGDDLNLEVESGRVTPDDYVVHYMVPAAHWWDDIGFN